MILPPKPCEDCGSPEKAGCLCEEQCPVCGYYCLGRGGYGCIDKPSMIALSLRRAIVNKEGTE